MYLLLGLLWQHIPYQIALESFELDPKRHKFSHGKYLDAGGKWYVDGEWRDIAVEFKLYSSGLRRDIQEHPHLHPDLLVCWIHDAPDVEQHAGVILALRKIYDGLPAQEREKIVLLPDKVWGEVSSSAAIADLLERFSMSNREKVRRLLEAWPQVTGGRSEILFKKGAITAFRACAYSSEHIIVVRYPSAAVYEELRRRFQTRKLGGTSLRVQLDSMKSEDVSRFVELMKVE